jgi:hypothetical protein
LNTRAIALTIVFAALSIALTPVAIPAVYMIGFFYRFWEIPIVAAFLLLSPKIKVGREKSPFRMRLSYLGTQWWELQNQK